VERRAFLGAVTSGLLAASLAAEAQPAQKGAKIGVLVPGSSSAFADRIDAFRRGLRDLSYFEGPNVTLEYRFAEGRHERLPDLAREIVQLNVGLILTFGTPATHAAKQATSTIPIVMDGVGDAVGVGLVSSLARPGGNITGSSYLAADLIAKRLQVLHELLSEVSEVTILVNPANPLHKPQLKTIEATAQSLGIRARIVNARDPEEIDSAFSAMRRQSTRALAVLDDGMFFDRRDHIAQLALAGRVPTILSRREEVEAGGLISYGPNFPAITYRAATFADRILKGAKPGDLPVEQPTKFELVINLKTAKALGLTIPPSLLARADQVIE